MRVAEQMEAAHRIALAKGEVGPTKRGHIDPSSLKKQHIQAIAEATKILREETRNGGAQVVERYTLQHTSRTRWAPHMDPWITGLPRRQAT